MIARRETVLLLAALTLSPAAAGAEEPKAGASHIEAVRTFLIAWGHGRWDDVRDMAADTVTVTVADKTFRVEPTARTSEVTVLLPFRGLSTVRSGAEVRGVMVSELGVRVDGQELRGPATVVLKDEAGRFRVVGVSVNGTR